MPDKVRIKDIARIAGVSPGTVDRVIHNRGNVSETAKRKVLAVMDNFDYKPNIIASTLAYNRILDIAIIIPDHRFDPYWQLPKQGIDKALKAVNHYRVSAKYFQFIPNDLLSFQSVTQAVIDAKPSVVILAPEFEAESLQFISQATTQEIPCILINTDLCGMQLEGYIGQDSFQSGMLAGKLIKPSLSPHDKVLIIHIEKHHQSARHLKEKEKGFNAYFEQVGFPVDSESLIFEDHSLDTVVNKLNPFFNQSAPPKGLFVTNSRSHLVAAALDHFGASCCLVGFDLIEKNVAFLRQDKIRYLINQNPELQGFYAIINLVNKHIFKKRIEPKMYLPIDIVVKENVQYYLDRSKTLTLV